MAEVLLQAAEWLFIVVAVGGLAGWAWLVGRRKTTGRPLVEPRLQQEPYWSFAEFFVGFGLMLICSTAAIVTARRYLAAGSPDGVTPLDSDNVAFTSHDLVVTSLAGSTAQLLVLASLAVWMGLTRREYLERWGLWPRWSDVRLGLVASLLILPPILVCAQLLDRFVEEYEHPVLEAVKQQPTLAVFLSMTFSAAIVAPIFEEFLFRALLQGSIQKLTRRLAFERQATESEQDRPALSETIAPAEVASWPWGAVVISSATFAVMHLGNGAAPIALFFFALALGYLYRQTGRLWPCITVHFALNLFSMVILGLEVAADSGQ
jgi:membrane protease YdiL (CAAX protease family)